MHIKYAQIATLSCMYKKVPSLQYKNVNAHSQTEHVSCWFYATENNN